MKNTTDLLKYYQNIDLGEIEALLKNGADIDAQDEMGETLIFKAMSDRNEALVELLLDCEANYEIKDLAGFLPSDSLFDVTSSKVGLFDYLSFSPKDDACRRIYDLLEERYAIMCIGKPALFAAVWDKSSATVAKVKEAIGKQIGIWDVNLRLNDGTTPLHLAIKTGNPKIVLALLKQEQKIITNHMRKGMSTTLPFIDSQDQNGQTALHFAVLSNDLTIVEILLEAGADSQSKNKEGLLPLDLSSGQEMSALLLKPTQATKKEVNVTNLSPIEKCEDIIRQKLVNALEHEYKFGKAIGETLENLLLYCTSGEEAGCYGLYPNSKFINEKSEDELEESCKYNTSDTFEGAVFVQDVVYDSFDVDDINQLVGDLFDYDPDKDPMDTEATICILQRICLQLEHDKSLLNIPLDDKFTIHIDQDCYIDFDIRKEAKKYIELPIAEYLKAMTENE